MVPSEGIWFICSELLTGTWCMSLRHVMPYKDKGCEKNSFQTIELAKEKKYIGILES